MEYTQKPLRFYAKTFLFGKLTQIDFTWVLTMLVLQQIIVASSSFWLSKFAFALEKNLVNFQYLILFCISLLAPYLPGALSLFFLKRWELNSHFSLWKETFSGWDRLFPVWNDPQVKSKQTNILVKDGPQLLSDTTKLIYDLLSSGLNVGLNLLVIGLVLDYKSVLAFGIGTGVILLSSFKMRAQTKKTARHFENSKRSVSVCLSHSWDNQILNNKLNKVVWNEEFRTFSTELFKSALTYLRAQEISSTLLSILAYLPMIALILVYAIENIDRPGNLVPMIVLFPRIFMLLNMMTTFLFHFRSLTGIAGRWHSLAEVLDYAPEVNLEERISKEKISISYVEPHKKDLPSTLSLESLFENTLKSGRVTIRGTNGSGKSTLLTLLKKKFGDDAFILPTRSDLKFRHSNVPGSSGQIVQKSMNEAFDDSTIKVFLLDEWDANLDSQNKSALNHFIDQFSESRLVVEIRH